MTQLTRRTLLAGTRRDAVVARIVLHSATPRAPGRRQADAGFYRYKVGDIEVTVVTDGVNRFKAAGRTRDQREAGGREGTRSPRPS